MLKKPIVLGLILLFTLQFAHAQKKHELQSMMMLSFLRYVQWPAHAKQDNLVIGVYGDQQMYLHLNEKYDNTTRNGHHVRVINITKSQDLVGCNLLYVGDKKSKDFGAIADHLDGKSVLLITNNEGEAHKGSCINFKTVDNKIKFELNKQALSRSNLKVSSQLTNLAILI